MLPKGILSSTSVDQNNTMYIMQVERTRSTSSFASCFKTPVCGQKWRNICVGGLWNCVPVRVIEAVFLSAVAMAPVSPPLYVPFVQIYTCGDFSHV